MLGETTTLEFPWNTEIRYGWCGDRKIDPISSSKLKKYGTDSVVSHDYMIPVYQDEILTCPAGTDFIPRLHGEIKFHHDKERQFCTWYLFKFVPHAMTGYNFWRAYHNARSQQNGTKFHPDEPGLHGEIKFHHDKERQFCTWYLFKFVPHAMTGYNFWRAYNNARSRQNGTKFHPDEPG